MSDVFIQAIGHFIRYSPVFTVYQRIDPNPYAAFPSLHIGYTMLVCLTARRLAPTRWSWLALLYPLAMSFAVVYQGQHYVVDCVAGTA